MIQTILTGGVIVRFVYAADLFSVVLRGPEGKTTGDDFTLKIDGIRGNTIERRDEEPPLFSPGWEDRGPCPTARSAARLLIAASSETVLRVPCTGRGWLDRLKTGAIIHGDLLLKSNGVVCPISKTLVSMGYAVDFEETKKLVG